jgi:hypothetical protein
VLGSGPGVDSAAELIGQSLAPSTQSAYQRLWIAFGEFCRTSCRTALPASPATVCAFLGTLFESGRVRGFSIRPYVAAIGAQHRRLALTDPTAHELVKLARRGYAAADARRHTGAPLRSAAYPAAAARFCLDRALDASDTLRYWAVVFVGFLLAARPASVLALSADAICIIPSAVLAELRVFKYGESGFAPRVSLSIPTTGDRDPVRLLFLKLFSATAPSQTAFPWFTRLDLVSATAAGLRHVSAAPPPGARFTTRSLRSGGITAAYSVGVPLERIMRLSNHSSTAVVMRYYLDPLVSPSADARVFFLRFVRTPHSPHLPAAPVSPYVGNPRAAEPSTSTELRLVS